MLCINTNLQGLVAQNSLKNSTFNLDSAIERMTTGYKINHAQDNAANYSITTNMSTKIGSYQVAEDNVLMGLDMLSSAGDSLSLITDKLARLRALAEQAANETYGEQSINAIYAEADAITDEIYRIKASTEYNGKKIFGENAGPDMSCLRIGKNGFIQNIKKRNTDTMTSIASIDESAVLAKGTYSISSAEELAKLARMQNSGKIEADSEFVLGADIDLSAYTNWTPIGWESGNTQTSKAFSGTFDGNGYKIRNLKSNITGNNSVGLFGSVGTADFKNLGFENVNLTGKYVGTLAAVIKDNCSITVSNCYAENAQIHGSQLAGGLIGGKDKSAHIETNTYIELTSCYTKDVIIDKVYWGMSGGIVGGIDKSYIKDCFSTNFDISITGSQQGGIIGISQYDGTIENCYAIGSIKNSISYNGQAGGITSGGDLTINNCYFEGSLSGGMYNGGIFGGCCGIKPVYIKNCTANADIKSCGKVGGISGWQDGEGGSVINCHFNGKLSGTKADTDIGSIVGGGVEDKLKVENCTYNKELNGEIKVIGDNLGTAKNVTDRVLKTIFQVGIHADENSQIDINTFLEFDELRTLSLNGLRQENALEMIDKLTLKISSIQTDLGSSENRLQSALDEISTQYENLVSSRSTLKDADIAKISSEYIQHQILQQASATLLATANQSPALALQLL